MASHPSLIPKNPVEAGRKPRPGLKLRLLDAALVAEVEAGRKPRPGLKPSRTIIGRPWARCRGREKTQTGIETP